MVSGIVRVERGIEGERGRCHEMTRWWWTFLVGIAHAVGMVKDAAAAAVVVVVDVEGALSTSHLLLGQSSKSQQWRQ